MASESPTVSSTSHRGSEDPVSTSSTVGSGKKTGRPNQWTTSRQRKLARLYLYSILPPNDIRQALEEKQDKWAPGKESTTKTVHGLLDKDPRWLRPKNQEEMDRRLAVLSDCTTHRKHLRKFSPRKAVPHELPVDQLLEDPEDKPIMASEDTGSVDEAENGAIEESMSSIEFSETPLEDLLSFVQEDQGRRSSSSTIHQPLWTPNDADAQQEDFMPAAPNRTVTFEHDATPSEPYVKTETDDKSFATGPSTTSLKKRLSKYSAPYLKDIAMLMKAHSISTYTSASQTQMTSSETLDPDDDDDESMTATLISSSPTIRALPSGRGTITLPSAFLFLDRYVRRQGFCRPGLKSHDDKTCWCVEDLQPNSRLWISKTGMANERVEDPPGSLKHLDLRSRDIFGNTALHLLAARDSDIELIFKALKHGADGNARNTAGQSFLHLLPRHFLRMLARDANVLMDVLPKLARFGVRFHDCDIFGRSFLHILTIEASDIMPNALQGLRWVDRRNRPLRDAFGWIPAIDPNAQVKTTAPFQRTYSLDQLAKYSQLSPGLDEDGDLLLNDGGMSSSGSPQSSVDGAPSPGSLDPNSFIFKHARLLEIAAMSIDVPDVEDSQGRNGLQCLAEASLALGDDPEGAATTSSSKRKRGQTDPTAAPTRLTFRFELVQKMVAMGVDLNNYDNNGQTVLMAFVSHLHDGEDDKTLTKILYCIIQNGANVHWRNRKGETALHIAVCLGHKVATRVLLESGANVHARTSQGKGVLVMGEAQYLRARHTPQLYASIMACMALCIQYGAVALPSAVQEWSMDDDEAS